MKTVAIIVIITFSLSGCASIFHGTKETIHVRSDEPETHFTLNSRDLGKGTIVSTTVSKKEISTAVLHAEKPGCITKSQPIETSFDGITLLGILIDFGLISILVIDWGITGAVTKAKQTDYSLTPECPKKTTRSNEYSTACIETLQPIQEF
jgi:hypothetical protein